MAGGLAVRGEQLSIPLDSTKGLDLHGVNASVVQYRGRTAVKLTETSQSDEPTIAVLKGLSMGDGTITAEVSGAPGPKADDTARGFVGIAFRVQREAKRFECIYLRPTNGRASDQVRRNHSVQYVSHPDYPWERLRKEEPGKYETYVDLEPGVWTKMRIVVSGRSASLYVNGAAQPTLLVNDLKLDATAGGIALWIGPGTEAYFADVTVSTRE